MTISNKETLRLKEILICGRTQTVYHPREYPPRTFPQYLIDENENVFEVVGAIKQVEQNTIVEKTQGVEVKAINNVVVEPPVELPPAETIELGKPVGRRVKTKATVVE